MSKIQIPSNTTEPQQEAVVKDNILEVLAVEAQIEVVPTQSDSIDPVASKKEIDDRFDKANTRLLKACRKMAAGKEPFDLHQYCPEARDTAWNVERYSQTLGKPKEALSGKEARIYRGVVRKAKENVGKLEALATDTEGKTPQMKAKKNVADQLAKANEDVAAQQKIVTPLTTGETDIEKQKKTALANLKIAPIEKKIGDAIVKFGFSAVNQVSLDKAPLEIARLEKLKNATPTDKFYLESWRKVLAKQGEFTQLSQELKKATTEKEAAEEELKSRKLVLTTLEQDQAKRKKPYTDKHDAVKKLIDLLIASGTCFGEDHSAFLATFGEIEADTQQDEAYEDAVKALEPLETKVKAAAVELQKKVVAAAGTATNELAAVKDPEELAGDPVRKKRVDDARELIAKRLREPLVGTVVVAARSEIPGFAILVKDVGEELEKRPDQVIACTQMKLVYGEPLSKIGPSTSGDGELEYFAEGTTKVEGSFVLNAGSKKVLIVAGPTTNFKPAKKEVTITVDKDTPTITWRTPVPILQNKTLTTYTLANATAKTSFGKPVTLALTYDPAPNTVMATLGDQTVKASFAGNENFNAVPANPVTVKVVADEADMGKEAMMSGRAWVGPSSFADKQLVNKWNTDDTPGGIKKQAQKVMSDILSKDMTGDEIVAYMHDFISPTGAGAGGGHVSQGGTFPCEIWYMANGLQVRYKPLGDGRPPTPNRPQFMVEGKTCNNPNQPSRRQMDDVAFKVTATGEPAAFGPDQTILPEGIPSDRQSQRHKNYMDGACGTTHLRPKTKVEQTISWTNPPDITEGDPLGEASLKPQAEDPDALEFTDETGTIITKDTVLAARNGQPLRVKGKEALRYLASANFVEVTINIKKVQTVTWNPPTKELAAGTALAGLLNATATSGVQPVYYLGNNLVTGTSVLPVGDHELKAVAPSTDLYHASEPVPVTITVKPKEEKK